jgi:ubiquinone/menaquinone biosynthesis C-methylase UbiE
MSVSREQQLFYTTIADDFDRLMNDYDVCRRVEVVFEELLPEDINGKSVLDVGCGTGWFSRRAHERGALVTSLDVGIALLRQTLNKVQVVPTIGDALYLPFNDESFDIVVSSEVIEHTAGPGCAVIEMGRVLRPNGVLVLTCPNKVWQWSVDLANQLGLRPFHGHERFPSFTELENYVRDADLALVTHVGLHPWPFQIRWLWPFSRQIDKRLGAGRLGKLMINQAIRAEKR